jgi:hypothetical protein
MSVKAVFDTSVIISLIDRTGDLGRMSLAKKVYDLLINKGVEVVYNQTIKIELMKKTSPWRIHFLENHNKIKYYPGNKTTDKIEETWYDYSFEWNYDDPVIQNRIQEYLNSNKQIRDSDILLDAISNGCKFFIHENPKDYNRVQGLWEKYDIINLDLCQLKYAEVEAIILDNLDL